MVSRRNTVFGLCAAAIAAPFIARSRLGEQLRPSSASAAPLLDAEPWAAELVHAAEAQIGVTIRYDPAYVRLAYPMGDVPEDRGVCTDVVIRAYRSAFGFDLQQHVHDDMRAAFADYPRIWRLARPDRNIDHRRVPNLDRFLSRRRAALPITQVAADYSPGDLVTQRLPGNLPHIAIVSRTTGPTGAPKVVHNIGGGARLEDTLFGFPIVGHFRLPPDAA
jgi:uncharacterized protein YijF (DUF1287 family)